MHIKHPDLEIPIENPFANCKLEREKYADILTNIVSTYSDGFVMAINNEWGTGKTTFVKMWQQKLNNEGHKTIYFNAWENDFEDNPLTAIMGELKSLTKLSTNQKFKSTLKKAAILSKHVGPAIVQSLADKYIDTKSIKEALKEVTKGLTDIFENEVNDYAERKNSIIEFKRSLADFIADTYNGKPFVFIIDELDRCRPNYAVSILEQIKHFFTVPNVVFVLSIDKNQLGSAIKGVYGSESLNSEEYLRKFIDLEYSIPEPNKNLFYTYLFDYFKFKDFFDSPERKQLRQLQNDGKYFLKVTELIFTNKNLPLRQQEKIFSLARISLRSFNLNNYVVPEVLIFLSFIKILEKSFYDDLKFKKSTIQNLQENFLKTVITNKTEKTENELILLEAYLLNFYDNYLESNNHKRNIYRFDRDKGENILLIDSIVNKEKNKSLLWRLENLSNSREGDLDLGYFISRIDLMENLIL